MDVEKWLFLTMTERLKGQRTGSGAVYLLNGKRSSQTLQDASLFYVLPLTGSLKHRSVTDVHGILSTLAASGLVRETDRGLIDLTREGLSMKQKLDTTYTLPEHYNAGRFEWNGEADWFWKRLSLYIQSLSSVMAGIKTFIPIQYDYSVQSWVRDNFPSSRQEREDAAASLYSELSSILSALSDEYASLFVRRLSSGHRAGESFTQLAGETGDPNFTYIRFRSCLHFILARLSESRSGKKYILQNFMKPEEERTLMSRSARETLDLLLEGKTMKEIGQIRRLRRSTLEDHVVEITMMHSGFDASRFVSSSKLELVKNTAEALGTNRLKVIKDTLGSDIDYFTIRLALAEMKGDPHAQTF
ncbi:helix-turn-helix domain-containing protein [Alteribacter natronophilus]|uniref:helix-turn-helix domain-containing protein n=1 Tax=Alteribacter natronophilus TaxID=2583810 RepID=UPI00110D5F9C|nr:helix-turn-helix domain-containing protein [Alteribacter natronophilus]TMW73636.1 hypothetical protein FGB90_04875 [Alteribacter natronophilus]